MANRAPRAPANSVSGRRLPRHCRAVRSELFVHLVGQHRLEREIIDHTLRGRGDQDGTEGAGGPCHVRRRGRIVDGPLIGGQFGAGDFGCNKIDAVAFLGGLLGHGFHVQVDLGGVELLS